MRSTSGVSLASIADILNVPLPNVNSRVLPSRLEVRGPFLVPKPEPLKKTHAAAAGSFLGERPRRRMFRSV